MRISRQLARPRLLPADRPAPGTQPRLPGDCPQAAQAQLPHPSRPRRGGAFARMRSVVRAKPSITPMHSGQLLPRPCRHVHVDGLHRPSGRTASPKRGTPSTIMSPTRSQPGSWTEIRLGARAHLPLSSASTAPVKRYALGPKGRPAGDRAPPPALKDIPFGTKPRTPRRRELDLLDEDPCTGRGLGTALLNHGRGARCVHADHSGARVVGDRACGPRWIGTGRLWGTLGAIPFGEIAGGVVRVGRPI